MLQHISPHFAATNSGSTAATNASTTSSSSSSTSNKSSASISSGEESPGRSHERSPSPVATERHTTPSPQNCDEYTPSSRSPKLMVQPHSRSEQSGDEAESADELKTAEPRRRLKTAAMKKAMDMSPVRLHRETGEEDEEEEDDREGNRSRSDSRCDTPPLQREILPNRVSISQKLGDKFTGSIIRRALKQESDTRDPVVVLNHQRLLLRDRAETRTPPNAPGDDRTEDEEEDIDSNVPLDLSLNAEEKLKREQTEMFLRQHKNKEDGSESDDSGGPGEDRGRAYKKSLMKRYCKYLGIWDLEIVSEKDS